MSQRISVVTGVTRALLALALMCGVLVVGAAQPASAAPMVDATADRARPESIPQATAAERTYATAQALSSTSVVSLAPARFLETRSGPDDATFDGEFQGEGRVAAGGVKRVQIAGRGLVPAGAVAAVLNVTSVGPSANSYVTVFPCTPEVPNASSLNIAAGGVSPNEVIAKLSASGEVCLFTLAESDLLIDVVGYVADESSTSVIPDVAQPGWAMFPNSLVLEGAGDTATAQLVRYDDDGNRLPDLPTGAVTPISNVDAGIEVAVDANGVISVSTDGQIGEEIVALEIEGERIGPLVVHSVNFRPGVVQVDQASILFPTAASGPDPAPFALADLPARTIMPDAGGEQSSYAYPYVVAGAPPVPGTLVFSNGAAPMMGRVVELPGGPQLTRDGFSLITVQTVPMNEIFLDVESNYGLDAIRDLGLTVEYEIEEGPEVDVGAPVNAARFAEARVASVVALALKAAIFGKNVAVEAAKCALAGSGIGVNVARITETEVALNLTPVFDSWVNINQGDYNGFKLLVGVDGAPEFKLGVLLQAQIDALLRCPVGPSIFGDYYAPGWLGLVASATAKFQLFAELQAILGLGPDLSAEITCRATFRAVVGVIYTTLSGLQNLSEATATPATCEPKYDTSFDPRDWEQMNFEIAFRVKPTFSAGVRFGGGIATFIGGSIGFPALGFFSLVDAYLGQEAVAKLENSAATIVDQQSQSSLETSIIGAIEPRNFSGFLSTALGPVIGDLPGLAVTPPVTKFDTDKIVGVPTPAGAAVVTVNGEPESGVAEVKIGEVLAVEVAMNDAPDVVFAPDISEVHAYIQPLDATPTSYSSYDDFDMIQFNAFDTVRGSKLVDVNLCREFNEGARIALVGEAIMLPIWIGIFEVRCDSEVDFDPKLLELDRQTTFKTLTLRQRNLEGANYEIFTEEPDSRITLDPAGGTFVAAPIGGDGFERIDVEAFLACGDTTDDIAPVTYAIRVDGDVIEDLEFVVDADCRESRFDIEQDLVDAGAAISFDTSGPTDDKWVSGSQYIQNDASQPVPGFLPGNETTSTQPAVTSAITIDPRKQIPIPIPCGEPGLLPLPEEIVVGTVSTTDRKSDSVKIRLPFRAGKQPVPGDCPPPAGPKGDPHIYTFDGENYDAQVLGEYVLGESADGATRIVSRFERTSNGVANPFKPTSTTAASFEMNGHLIEAYARPFRVYVDGVDYNLPVGLAFDVGDGVVVTRTGRGADILAPDFSVEITTFAAPIFGILQGLNVNITAPSDGSLTGLLGTNDGDVTNDLTLSTGGSITLEEADAHDIELYSLTDSWRITDRVDSPFSLQYAGFDDANEPRPGSETLAPFRQEALDLLGGVSDVCAGEFEDGARIIDVLAIELAIGRPPEDLGDVTCGFRVHGSVTLDSPQIGALGSTVLVDAPGLAPCEATVTDNGSYSCSMEPDVAELDTGVDVSFPLPISVAVTAAGADTVGATASGAFPGKPVFGGAASQRIDVVLPAATATTLVLDGTLTEYGAPFAGSASLRIEGTDGDGNLAVATTRRFTVDAGGGYSQVVAIPVLDEMTVTWLVGDGTAAMPFATLGAFVSGPNARTVDLDFSPPTLDVTGEIRFNGSPPTFQTVVVGAQLDDGSTWSRSRTVYPDPATGAYDLRVVVPDDIESASLSTRFGDHRNGPVTLGVPTVTAGLNPVVFDAVFDAPVLNLSGTAEVNGVPVAEFVDVVVNVTRADDSVIRLTQRRPVTPTGAYSYLVDLVEDAVSAEVILQVGVTLDDHPTLDIPAIVDGVNEVVFEVDHATPRVDVAGSVSSAGVPYTDGVVFVVSTDAPQAFSTQVTVTPDAAGAYSFSADLPIGTTTADIQARVGSSPVLTVDTTASGLVDGANAVPFDAVVDAVVLQLAGRFTEQGAAVADDDVVISIRRFDAGGALLQTTSRTATTDTNGNYTLDVFLDDDTASVELAGVLGPLGDDRYYERFDGLVALNPLTFDDDYNPPILDVTGVFTAGGVPLAGRQTVVAVSTVGLPDGGTADRTEVRRPVVNLSDGSYADTVMTPETTTDVALEARIGPDPADYPTLLVPGVVAGSNPVTFSADLPLPVFVDFYADLEAAAGPFTGSASFTYRTYDAVDAELATASLSGTADAIGQFFTPIILDQDVRRVEFDWNIGLPSDPKITRSFDVVPGFNTVVFSGEHAPPVLELSGDATLNGDVLSGGIDLVLDVVREGDVAWATTTRVFPNSTTGAYTRTVTLPRDAESATVTASLDQPLPNDPQAVLPALAGGVNDVDFDLAFAGPRLDVSGVIFNGDTPPVGEVIVVVTATADGETPLVQNVSVFANLTTGAYAFDLLLPPWATDAELVAQVGPTAADWPTLSVAGLTPDTIPVDFDAVVADQVLAITGTFTVGGQPWTDDVQISVGGQRGDGGRFSRSFIVEPDVNGGYDSLFVPPSDAVSVTLSAVVLPTPFAHPQQEYTGLSSGVNDLVFDVAFEGRAVAVSGRITDNDDPVVGNVALYVRSFVGSSTSPSSSPTVGVQTDIDGRYDAQFLVPADVTEIEFSTQLGDFSGDRVPQRTAGLVDGVNVVVFDDNYVAPIINLSGNLLRDGAPITDPVTVEIAWIRRLPATNGSFTDPRIYSVTADALGDYTLDAVGPRLVDDARITVRVGVTEEEYPTTTVDPLVLGANPATLDVNVTTTSVSLSGTANYRGDPATNKNVVITSYDVNGDSLGDRNAFLQPDPTTGAYTLDFDVPSASEDIEAVVRFGGLFDTYEYVRLDLDVTPGTTTSATWNIATTSVAVTGNVQGPDGAFDNESFTVGVIAKQGATDLATLADLNVNTDASGDYSVVVFLPDGTDNISFAPQLAGVAPIAITGVAPGELDSVQDLVTAGGDTVSLSGVFSVNGVPPVDEPTITVVGYTADDYGYGPVDFTEVSRFVAPHVYTSPGDFVASGVVDVDAEFMTVEIAFPNPFADTIYRRSFDLRGAAQPFDFTFDIAHDGARVEFSGFTEVVNPDQSGDTFCEAENGEFVWTATVVALDGPAGDPGTTQTEIFSTVILPTGSQFGFNSWDLVTHIPAGTQNLILDVSASDFHDPFFLEAEYGVLYALTGGYQQFLGQFIDATCTPEPGDF